MPRGQNFWRVLDWVIALPCRGGDCEAEVVGDRYQPINCRRHERSWELAKRISGMKA